MFIHTYYALYRYQHLTVPDGERMVKKTLGFRKKHCHIMVVKHGNGVTEKTMRFDWNFVELRIFMSF